MIRIALDLELEQPWINPQTPDSKISKEQIIQVGYVVFNDETGEELLSVCEHVHFPYPLSGFIKSLTGIKDNDVLTGEPLEKVVDDLHAHRKNFDASRKLLTWGAGDQEAIKTEYGNYSLWGFGHSAFNVKHLFQFYAELNNISPRGGLKKSCNKMGLLWRGRAHNALADAVMTKEIFMELKSRFSVDSKS